MAASRRRWGSGIMATSDIVLAIRIEHRNFARLLDILEQQAQGLEREGRLDQDLVGAVLDYFVGYADQCHHPKEDLVYRKLRALQEDAEAEQGDLLEEHEELERVTGRLADLVRETRGQASPADDRLATAMRRFLGFYRDHMGKEESQLLPAAERLLTANDWKSIEFDLFDKPDPVFDPAAEQNNQALMTRILAMSGGRDARSPTASAGGGGGGLGEAASLAQFNDAMAEHGLGARLSRAAEGGYRLAAPEGTLVTIPELGEAEAVRCAIYFLKGQGSLP